MKMVNENGAAGGPVASTKVIVGPVRLSYCHLWEPWAAEEGQEPKYSVSLIIPKTDKKAKREVDAAVRAAIEQGKSKYGDKYAGSKNLKLPLRDGDERETEDEAYVDAWYLNANSATKPGVVDRNRKPVLDQDEVYSGCYGYVSVNFYPFDKNGNRGVACGLNHVMKTKDGEPLGGRSTAEFDFMEIEVEDDDL
jgi:hypothetical protein